MNVLIIEDQTAKCTLLANAIKAIGNQVEITHALNAHDGFKFVKSGSFNLVLLDVVLPLTFGSDPSEEGSLWFVREVHRKLAGVQQPLIVGTTQYADSLAKVEANFREYLWSIIHVADHNELWPRQLQQAVRFAQSNAPRIRLTSESMESIDVAIITALRIPEFSELVNALGGGDPIHLTETNESWLHAKITAHNGLEQSIVAACADDMGMTAMASLVTRLTISCRPKKMILPGIMGGNAQRVSLSDLICVEETWDCRAGKITEKGFQADVKSRSCSYKLVNQLLTVANDDFRVNFWRKWSGERPDRVANIYKGAVACSPAVIADDTTFSQLESQKRKILGVEMEAYGCYDAVHRLGDIAPDVVCVKSVCDLGDNAKNDKYQRYCAALSAAVAIELVKDSRFF